MKLNLLAALSLLASCTIGWAAPVRAQDLPAPISLNAKWQLQDIAKVTAPGDELSRIGYKPSGWYRATVPGTVLTSLVDDGVYPEPLYGENNRPDKIPESLCRTSYWYRTTFVVPQSFSGRHVFLNFAGINYLADVWVNGRQVGTIKGAFARGIFDVTANVGVGRANAVAVKIMPPPHPGNPIEQTIQNGVGPNGGVLASDGPTFLCTIGWDWIPGVRDRDMGIWQGVSLTATGPVVVQDPYVTSDVSLASEQLFAYANSADLTIQATLRNVTDKPQSGTLTGTIEKINFRQPVVLAPNETKTVTLTPATAPQLHLLKPRLWWPNGYGAPNLYTLHLRFVEGASESDGRNVSFGIRKITYFVPGSDNLTLSVNGVPVFAKGGDWGMDEAMKRIGIKRMDAQIRMHRDANYTIIRNWVGQSTSDVLYDLCDKYGILLWDEFFQPNPSDGPNPTDTDLYLANVREKMLRYRNHPSIALWCARNEGDPPPAIDAGIQKLMAELERQRRYQHSSTAGNGVRSGGPYFWRAPRDFYRVDAPFKTEIGSVSIPTLESIQGMMPAKDWNTINDDWAEHDLARGAQGGDRYPNVLGARYGCIASLADFARKGQMANYEAFRAMYEGREAQLFHPATAVITWMSNPAQPSFVWQLYSHDLEPNAALFGTRKACEPIHIMMNQSNGHVAVINNTPESLTGVVAKTTIYNLNGTPAYTHTDTVTAAPSAATDVGEIAFPTTLSPVHFVKLELRDAGGKLLSDNFYWRGATDAPDDFQALNELPAVTLEARANRRDDGSRCLIDVTLSNPTSSVALMAHLQLRGRNSGKRVLPVFYSDNYVSLLPRESRTIRIEAAREDLGTDTPLVVVDGWNVTVKKSLVGGKDAVSIAPNADAVFAPSPAAGHTTAQFALNIDCGGSGTGLFTFGRPASPNDFASDQDVRGGRTLSANTPIDTGVPHAAPEAVYQSERWGPCTYTIPVPKLRAGHAYTVRLHFADTTFDHAGARKFNVDINGTRVLTDFDIIAEAGGAEKAVVKDFPGIAADRNGNVVIALTNGSADQAEIRGIQVLEMAGVFVPAG